MTIRNILVGFALALGLAACGGSSGASDSDQLAQIFTDMGAPASEARCVADNLEGISPDEARDLVQAMEQSGGDIDNVDPSQLLKLGQAVQKCGLAE